MKTKRLADKLARDHGTRDPLRITNDLGYIVIDTPLTGIRGYYQYLKRCHIIYLNDSLSDHERTWVCAHELGHSLLHKGMNRVFMDSRTHMVTNRFEVEADHFAVDLIYSDDELHEYADCSFDTVTRTLGVSYSLAEYRMRGLRQ